MWRGTRLHRAESTFHHCCGAHDHYKNFVDSTGIIKYGEGLFSGKKNQSTVIPAVIVFGRKTKQ